MKLMSLPREITIIALLSTSILHSNSANADYLREAPGGWSIGKADDETCGMLNEFEELGRTTTLYFRKDVKGATILSVSNPDWTVIAGRSYNIQYKLNGANYGGASAALKDGFAIKTDPDFERDFAVAGSLYMTLDDKVVDHLSLTGSAQALKYLNQCVSVVKRAFDALERKKEEFAYINPNPFAAGKPLPVPALSAPRPKGNSGWANLNDYPSRALMQEREGNAKYRVTVGVSGKVTACEIISSSGHADLDAATCSNVTRRARFEPATDANGEPTTGYFEANVTWTIPR